MNADLYFSYFLAPSLSELKQRQAAERGLADGLDGKPPRSEATEYTSCYLTGDLFRRANAFEAVVCFEALSECPTCRNVANGHAPSRCHCTSIPVFGVPGYAVAWGPSEPDDDADFMSLDRLRQLCAQGVEVATIKGERLNEQILTQ